MYQPIYNQTEGQKIVVSGNPVEIIPNFILTGSKVALMSMAAAGALGQIHMRTRHLIEPIFESWRNTPLGTKPTAWQRARRSFSNLYHEKIMSPIDYGKRFRESFGGLANDIIGFRYGSAARGFEKFIEKNAAKATQMGIPFFEWNLNQSKKWAEKLPWLRKYKLTPGISSIMAAHMADQYVKQSGRQFEAYIGAASSFGGDIGFRTGGYIGYALGSMIGGPIGGLIGGGLGALSGATLGASVAPTLYKMAKAVNQWGSPETGGNFLDNQYLMTMRQRSLLAIRTSQLNLRSELGREAQILMGAMY